MEDKGSARALQLLHKVKLNCSIILSTFDYVFWPRQASLGFQLRLLQLAWGEGQKGKGAGELGNCAALRIAVTIVAGEWGPQIQNP